MSVFAGVFLFVFGGLGVWLLSARFPNARFLRIGYIFMSLGGLGFAAWALTHSLWIGLSGMVLLLIGGIAGAIGAFRKEVRL